MDIKKIIIMYVFTRIDSKVVLGLYSNRAIGDYTIPILYQNLCYYLEQRDIIPIVLFHTKEG